MATAAVVPSWSLGPRTEHQLGRRLAEELSVRDGLQTTANGGAFSKEWRRWNASRWKHEAKAVSLVEEAGKTRGKAVSLAATGPVSAHTHNGRVDEHFGFLNLYSFLRQRARAQVSAGQQQVGCRHFHPVSIEHAGSVSEHENKNNKRTGRRRRKRCSWALMEVQSCTVGERCSWALIRLQWGQLGSNWTAPRSPCARPSARSGGVLA